MHKHITKHHCLQMYFGLSLLLQDTAGPVHLHQVVGFAIEVLGCGVMLLVMPTGHVALCMLGPLHT